MFHVTVVNLTKDGRHAVMHAGPREVGQLSADELVALLNAFAEIDPVENNDADPEIHVQVRRNRHVIRTSHRKLLLHDSRDLAAPAYSLSAQEIIEEIDGTAAARRTKPPIPLPSASNEPAASDGSTPPQEVLLPAGPELRPKPIGLIALVLVLCGYIAYSAVAGHRGAKAAPITPLTPAETATEELSLAGAYMTGAEPGEHGIVILGAGKLELFQVNARGGPGTVYATYVLSRKDGALQLVTDQPGGLIKVTSRDALDFCGETYKRVRGR